VEEKSAFETVGFPTSEAEMGALGINGLAGQRERPKRRRGLPTFNVKDMRRPKKHVVYFVQAECGVIKIGTTGDLEWRMKSLQGQSPVPLTLLATVRGNRAKEHEYHRQFAAHRLHGEWFERCPKIEAEIERLRSEASQ
jgi:hypothetical protein